MEWQEGKREEALKVFNRTKDQIQKQQPRLRSKRSTPAQTLTQEQRINLKNFYQLHSELSDVRKEISSKMKELVDDMSSELTFSAEALSDRSNSKKIILSLMKVGWNGSNLRGNLSGFTEDLKNFFGSEEEVKKALDSLSQNKQNLQSQLSLTRRVGLDFGRGNFRMQNHFRQAAHLVRRELSNSSGDIQFVIGSKLLEWMGQLKNN